MKSVDGNVEMFPVFSVDITSATFFYEFFIRVYMETLVEEREIPLFWDVKCLNIVQYFFSVFDIHTFRNKIFKRDILCRIITK